MIHEDAGKDVVTVTQKNNTNEVSTATPSTNENNTVKHDVVTDVVTTTLYNYTIETSSATPITNKNNTRLTS